MPIGSLRVTNNETIYMLAQTLFGKMTSRLNIMTSGAGARFPDDVVLTGSPDDMIFNGKATDIFHLPLKIFSQTAGVKSPILEATYAYLTEADGLLADISDILADIILDIVHDMLTPNTVMNRIYNLLDATTQATIQLINTVGFDFVQALLNGLLVENVNVTQIIGELADSIV